MCNTCTGRTLVLLKRISIESDLGAVLGLEDAPGPAVIEVVRHGEEGGPQQLGVDLGALVVGVGEDLRVVRVWLE